MVRVLDRLDVEPRPLYVYAALGGWNETPAYDLGQFFEQHCLGRAGVDASAPCGETHGHAGLDVSGLDDHRGAGEDDLGGVLYLDPSAPSRAPVSAHGAPDLPLYAPGEEVLEGDPAYRVSKSVGSKEFALVRIRIREGGANGSLCTLIYVKGERTEIMRAGEVFVGPVSLAVYAVERRTQALHLYPRR